MASNTTRSSEVITLEGTGDNGNDNGDPETMRFKTNFKPKKQLKYYPYFSDPAIVPRVKQYLEDNKDKVYIDIDQMVSHLRRRYRDYSKKKTPAFKAIVEKAFQVVLHTYSVQDDTPRDGTDSSESEDMDVDSEEVDLIVDTNSSNDQVVNMYMQQQNLKKLVCPKLVAGSDETKELIDISSDDNDEDEVPAKRTKHADSTNCSDPKASSPPETELHKTNGQATPEEVSVAQEHVTTSSVIVPAVNATNAGSAAVAVAAPVTPSPPERSKRKRAAVDGGIPTDSATADTPKKRKRNVPVTRPCCSFKDVGGCTAVLQEVCKLLVHLRHPEVFEQIGVSPPRGFLLHGPPGCGKSLLANAIAGELGVPLLKVAATELIAGVSGESEERIRDLFDQAVSLAPCVLFLDEIDAITPNRNNAQREMERRVVAQLLTTLDELGEKEGGNQVLVVGATNRPDSLDPALRRAGRFDREVCMGIPDRESRAHILRVVCGRLALDSDICSDAGIEELASLTPGFVGADLTALTREAAMVAINRAFAEIQKKKEEADKTNNAEPQVIGEKTEEHSEKENGEVDEKTFSEAVAATKIVTDEPMDTEGQDKSENVPVATEEISQEETVKNSSVTAEPLVEESSTELEEDLKPNCLPPSEIQVQTDVVQDAQEISQVDETNKKQQSSSESSPPVVELESIPQIDCEIRDFPKSNESASCSESNKTEKEVEVLEEAIEKPSQAPDDNPVINDLKQKDLELSQKLLPSSIWSPQLCQLMSWLKDTPPLSPEELNNLTITKADFHEALRHVQPSSKREGFATVPDVTWDDVGSLANIRAELQLCVLAPVRYSKQFAMLGLNAPAGVLLCGPPGCGKTLLAKAVANEAGINFISVKGPELLNMYVGESERAVRQVFQRARNSAPCVIFFDELDALCPKRSDSGDNGVSSRVVNQLLTEMDGIEGRAAVFLMAASNRPDIIDPAVLRPGRLDKVVYVGLPNSDDRKDILRALTKNGTRPLLAPDVDLAELASRPELEGYSGADLAALVREAGIHALQEFIIAGGELQNSQLCVALKHFNSATAKLRPSVTLKDRKHYEKLQEKYCNTTPMDKKLETMDTA